MLGLVLWGQKLRSEKYKCSQNLASLTHIHVMTEYQKIRKSLFVTKSWMEI